MTCWSFDIVDVQTQYTIIYQISEIQEDLGFSKKKAIDYLTELEVFGVVEKKRRGCGLPSILYIKSFMSSQAAMMIPKATVVSEVKSAETETSDMHECE